MISLALIVAAVLLGNAALTRRAALAWAGAAALLVLAAALSPGRYELRSSSRCA